MFVILFFIVVLINLVFALMNKESKVVLISSLVFCWSMFWSSVRNADYSTWQEIYYQGGLSEDLGFALLRVIARNAGAPYTVFLMLLGAILYFSLYCIIKKTGGNPNTIIAIYMLSSFIFNIIQISDFAGCVCLYFAVIVYSRDYKYKRLCFILLVILASSMHIVFCFFIPFVIFSGKEPYYRSKLLLILLIPVLCVSLYMLFSSAQLPYYKEILTLFAGGRANAYIGNSGRDATFDYYFKQELVYLLLSYISKYVYENNTNEKKDNQHAFKFVNLVFALNVYTLCSIPLYSMDPNFYRIYRALLMLNIIQVSISADSYNIKYSEEKNKILSKRNIFILIAFAMIIFSGSRGRVEEVWMLINNSFMNF